MSGTVGENYAEICLSLVQNDAALRLRLVQRGDTTVRRELLSCVRRSTSHNVPQSCPITQQTRQTNSWIGNVFIIHLLLHVRPCQSPSTGTSSRLSHSLSDSSPMSTDQVCRHTQHRFARSLFGPLTGHHRTYP